MISYVTIGASDIDKAVAFYDPVMAALGHQRAFLQDGWAGYAPKGEPDKPTVLICKPFDGQAARAGNGVMLGLHAETAAQVDAFHAAALANGGTDEGAPGPRPEGGANYLAYVRDPTGNKLAAFWKGS
jgi:catechol 2,3-dioxygenase-like lactoylglutathione lyase family enzyme